jgi:hypothetical protein
MRAIHRKSEFDKLLDAGDKAVRRLGSGWSKGKVVKASLIAAGFAALTAGSAGISSLRRRGEGAKGRS